MTNEELVRQHWHNMDRVIFLQGQLHEATQMLEDSTQEMIRRYLNAYVRPAHTHEWEKVPNIKVDVCVQCGVERRIGIGG